MCLGMLRYELPLCNGMPWIRGFKLAGKNMCILRMLLKDVCGLGSG